MPLALQHPLSNLIITNPNNEETTAKDRSAPAPPGAEAHCDSQPASTTRQARRASPKGATARRAFCQSWSRQMPRESERSSKCLRRGGSRRGSGWSAWRRTGIVAWRLALRPWRAVRAAHSCHRERAQGESALGAVCGGGTDRCEDSGAHFRWYSSESVRTALCDAFLPTFWA